MGQGIINVRNHFRTDENKIKPITYYLDTCAFCNHKLQISGWAFVMNANVKDVQLKVKCGKQTQVITVTNSHKERSDVYQVFQMDEARTSGFDGEYELYGEGKAEIYLQLTTSNGVFYERIAIEKLADPGRRLEIKEKENLLLDYLSTYQEGKTGWVHPDSTVDVVVPVYNGYDYLGPLFDSILKTQANQHIYLINDCSSDERVLPCLEAFAKDKDFMTVICNETNLGFVRTVNKGLKLSKNHVAIVNTDVELPEGWLERLMTPIWNDKKVASTTPFSNCATIFSFPDFCENNEMYQGMNVDEMDSYFSGLVPDYTTVPTGMGFCMGMSRYAIKKIGTLDDISFEKGYGEENDWCQRAMKKGFRNVHVENLFVYHKHGGSFLPEEKKRLMEENGKKLSEKHPNYNSEVAAYISYDPVKAFRDFIRLYIRGKAGNNILCFDHSLGGGATVYLQRQTKLWKEEGKNVWIVRYDRVMDRYRIYFENDEIAVDYNMKRFKDIVDVFCNLGDGKNIVEEIYINELVSYKNLFTTLEEVAEMKKELNAKLIMLMHDYFSVCPSVNMISAQWKYCDEGKLYSCGTCFEEKGWKEEYSCEGINEWRSHWGTLFEECDEVRCFSEDTMSRLQRIYPEITNLTLVPHKVNYMNKLVMPSKKTETINIGLLGVLSRHKGKDIVASMCSIIERKELPIRFVLIGTVDGELIESEIFESTGAYKMEELPDMVKEKDIDVFFVPSIWPETFSYTTDEIIHMEMPIVSYNLGAPADRIEVYEKGHVLEHDTEEEALQEIMCFCKELRQ